MQGILDTIQEPAIKLALAILLGGLIGLEREIHGKSAGLRTNILICAGSAAIMIVSESFANSGKYGAIDPARIAAQVVTGVGFIGAGTIMQARGSVTGLTTAATIWVVAGIGLAVGAGLYAVSILAALFMLFVLLILGRIEDAVFRGRPRGCRVVLLADGPDVLAAVHNVLDQLGVAVSGVRTSRTERGLSVDLAITCGASTLPKVEATLTKIPGVVEMDVEAEAFEK